jgi:signal transduction histidine kinase
MDRPSELIANPEPAPAPAPAPARRRWTLLLVFTAIGLLSFGHRSLDEVANGHPGLFAQRLVEELTAAYAAALLFFPLRRWTRWIARQLHSTLAVLGAHAGALLLFAAAHTTLMWLSRSLLFPLLGLGAFDYGILRWRYAMEFPIQVIVYAMMAGSVLVLDHYRRARERELHNAQLQTQLAEAQLEALRLQLAPHFLFNTLNAISATVYESPRAADEMIARLSDLLRSALRSSGSQEIALGDELRLLGLYLDIMRARFGDRLVVELDVPAEFASAQVPYMLLQPLVENAIEYGVDRQSGRIKLELEARGEGETLVIEVRDHGPGPGRAASKVLSTGVGLQNTGTRLMRLYGAGFGVSLTAAADGGALARVRIPLRGAPLPG